MLKSTNTSWALLETMVFVCILKVGLEPPGMPQHPIFPQNVYSPVPHSLITSFNLFSQNIHYFLALYSSRRQRLHNLVMDYES